MYSQIKMQTNVSQEVIDSLGGIQNTIKPLEKSLFAHELRPFDYFCDYKQTLLDLRMNKEPSISSHRYKDANHLIENSKIVSASPFRATVKFDAEKTIDSDSNEADEFERDTMSMKEKSRHESPIKDDSEIMRSHRDHYLSTFTN